MRVVPDHFDESFPADPVAISRARAALAAYAERAGADPLLVADVRLAVSEAITNAVLHGYRGRPGEVHVSARVTRDGSLWIRVRDDGFGLGAASPVPSIGLGAGLGVISRIVEEVDVASRRRGGTDLRMRFDLRASAGGAAPACPGEREPAQAAAS